MTDHIPAVSVCILSHRQDMLPLALASIYRQTFTDYEICIKFSKHYWPEKLNELVRGSCGRRVIILCDDDELDPNALQRYTEEMDRTGCDIAYSDIRILDDRLPFPIWIHLPTFDAEVLRMHCVPYMTAMFTRALFDRVAANNEGRAFDGTLGYVDWGFWIDCCRADASAVHLKKEYLFLPRSHPHNGSKLMDNEAALRQLRRKYSALHQG